MKLAGFYCGILIILMGTWAGVKIPLAFAACSSGGSCYSMNPGDGVTVNDLDSSYQAVSGSCTTASGNPGLCYIQKAPVSKTTPAPTSGKTTPASPTSTTPTSSTDTPTNSSTNGTNTPVASTNSVAPTGSTTQYTQLEAIPGAAPSKSFPEYVKSLYTLGLWIVGISAMFMLTVGGFMYLTSAGNTSAAGTAKGVIKDALIGLVLGLSAWLIVNTINPDLTTLNVSGLQTGTSTTPPVGGGAPAPVTPPSGTTQESANAIANSKLASTGECNDAGGVAVSPISNINEIKQGQPMTTCSNGCNASGGSACTGKVNPSAAMISAINDVNGNYKVTSISGGSHAANSAHYSGSAMDVTPASVALRDDFIAKGARPNNPDRSGTFCEDSAGNFVRDCVGADHVHVRF